MEAEKQVMKALRRRPWSAAEASCQQQCSDLGGGRWDPPVRLNLQMTAALADILAVITGDTLSQKHSDKLLPDSPPSQMV